MHTLSTNGVKTGMPQEISKLNLISSFWPFDNSSNETADHLRTALKEKLSIPEKYYFPLQMDDQHEKREAFSKIIILYQKTSSSESSLVWEKIMHIEQEPYKQIKKQISNLSETEKAKKSKTEIIQKAIEDLLLNDSEYQSLIEQMLKEPILENQPATPTPFHPNPLDPPRLKVRVTPQILAMDPKNNSEENFLKIATQILEELNTDDDRAQSRLTIIKIQTHGMAIDLMNKNPSLSMDEAWSLALVKTAYEHCEKLPVEKGEMILYSKELNHQFKNFSHLFFVKDLGHRLLKNPLRMRMLLEQLAKHPEKFKNNETTAISYLLEEGKDWNEEDLNLIFNTLIRLDPIRFDLFIKDQFKYIKQHPFLESKLINYQVQSLQTWMSEHPNKTSKDSYEVGRKLESLVPYSALDEKGIDEIWNYSSVADSWNFISSFKHILSSPLNEELKLNLISRFFNWINQSNLQGKTLDYALDTIIEYQIPKTDEQYNRASAWHLRKNYILNNYSKSDSSRRLKDFVNKFNQPEPPLPVVTHKPIVQVANQDIIEKAIDQMLIFSEDKTRPLYQISEDDLSTLEFKNGQGDIKINPKYAHNPEMLQETVTHEMAHLILYNQEEHFHKIFNPLFYLLNKSNAPQSEQGLLNSAWNIFKTQKSNNPFALYDESNYLKGGRRYGPQIGHPEKDAHELGASAMSLFVLAPEKFAEQILKTADPELRNLGVYTWCAMRDQIFKGCFIHPDPFEKYKIF